MRSFFSRLSRVFLFFLVAGAVFISSLPTIMSSDWGKKQLTEWINLEIPGKLIIDRLELHWGGHQVIEGIILNNPDGRPVFTIKKIETEASLWKLFWLSTEMGRTEIQGLNGTILLEKNGATNLQNALGIEQDTHLSPFPRIYISDVNAQLELMTIENKVSGWIKGQTQQNEQKGHFEINLDLEKFEIKNWKVLPCYLLNYLAKKGNKNVSLEATVANFPVNLLDQLIATKNPALNGILSSFLGNQLNLLIEKEAHPDSVALNIQITSPTTTIQGKTILNEGRISIDQPLTITWNVLPELINPHLQKIKLLNQTELKINVDKLSLPFLFFEDQHKSDPCKIELITKINIEKIGLKTLAGEELFFDSFDISINAPLCEKTVSIAIKGQINQSDFQADFKANKPLNSFQTLQNLEGKLNIEKFPLKFIYGFPTELLGSKADLQLSLTPHPLSIQGHLALQTENIQLKETFFKIDKEFTLEKPAIIHLNLPKKISKIHLETSLQNELRINQLKFPLNDPSNINFLMESSIDQLKFSHDSIPGTFQMNKMRWIVTGKSFDKITSEIKSELLYLNPQGTPSNLTETPFQLTQTSTIKLSMLGGLVNGFIGLNLVSAKNNFSFEGNYQPPFFTIKNPTSLNYTLTPAALEEIGRLLGRSFPKLKKETEIEISLLPMKIDLSNLSIGAIENKGTLAINELDFQTETNETPIFEDISGNWNINAPKNVFSFNLEGLAYSNQTAEPSQMEAYVQLEQWHKNGELDLTDLKSEMQVDFTALPTSILSLLATESDWSKITGPLVDVSLKALFDPSVDQEGYLDLLIDSYTIHIKTRLNLGKSITLFNPDKFSTFQFTLHPDSFLELKKIMGIKNLRTLKSPLVLSMHVADLSLPYKGDEKEPARAKISFETSPIEWNESQNSPFAIQGKFQSENLVDYVDFNVEITSRLESFLILKGQIERLLDQNGHLNNKNAMAFDLSLITKQLPLPLIENLFFLSHKESEILQGVFGDEISLEATTKISNLSGPLKYNLKGIHSKTSFDGQLENGILTLRQPLEAEMQFNPALANADFVKNIPVLDSIIKTEKPITFSISPTNFSCPIIPFNLSELKIEKGTLDLGKVLFKNEGDLQSILSLIKSFKEPELTIWFTPLYFSIHQGIATIERIDLLIGNNYSLALWGSFGLATGDGSFVIGIPGSTFQKVFGIKLVESNELFQIPLQIRRGKIEINKTKMTGLISAAVAKMQIEQKVQGLGSLLDIIVKETVGESTPPPTTSPFPWATETSTPSSKEKKEKRDKNLMNELEKGASKVINHLFKK